MTRANVLSEADRIYFEENGYVISRGMFTTDEVLAIKDRFDALGENGEGVPGYWEPDFHSHDPLKRYPRVMFPNRWDNFTKAQMLKPEVGDALERLMGETPIACQAMYYFKPPGSPGQSLHQDNFYLAVQPTTCYAAWTAIDPAFPDNGGLYVVPGTHNLDVQCPDVEELVRTKSTNLVEPPKGMRAVPAELEPGDTLFFNGSLIHGSKRNKTEDTWRRSLICHYMPESSVEINGHYLPVFGFDGKALDYQAADAGGPCGYSEDAPPAYNTYGVDATI